MSEDLEIKKIVGQVAAAYFGNSHVTPTEIPTVISQIANSIAAVGAPATAAPAAAPEQARLSAAQIRRSVTHDAIISFEDDKPYKTLRRHLASRGLTPAEYRSKWGLPNDYPMVAPAYSETRSKLAKARGLGGRPRAEAARPEPTTAAPEAPSRPTRRRPPSAAAAAALAAPAPSVAEPSGAAEAETPRRRSPNGRRRTKKSPGGAGALH